MKNKFIILAGLTACAITGGSLYVSYNLNQDKIALIKELNETKENYEKLQAENKDLISDKEKLENEQKEATEKENENEVLNDSTELSTASVLTYDQVVNNTNTQTNTNKPISNPSWNGSVLTPQGGVNYGMSGKETYYNLPMDGVISGMREIGNNDPYWVREDGVKMLGDYVMIAADYNTRPKGTLVETSLGTGIVCDTGTFVATDPTQIDIAVTW